MGVTRTLNPQHPDYDRKARGPNGRPLCRRCLTEVEGRRRTFCSDACVEEWILLSQPGARRSRVYARDHGVCASCGLDTRAVAKAITRRLRKLFGTTLRGQPVKSRESIRWLDGVKRWMAGRGFHRAARSLWMFSQIDASDLWDADHIQPIVEGGDVARPDLSNHRTLCCPCHKRETAALAARRAGARVPERTAEKATAAPLQHTLFPT